ncbi:MAG: 3-oxoacyl-ACP synthase [Bacteroidetes bacterium]|nr:3-oxoacyl-ACP synthase [Bacteroidota bacterium]
MKSTKSIKSQLQNQLIAILEGNALVAKTAIASAKESRDNDTKSSAGDKYETGRAMMQIEIENNEMQLLHAMNQMEELSKINFDKDYKKIEFGCLVSTSQGKYYISIGHGKLMIDKDVIYAISLGSPIGALLKNKVVGDKVSFQGRDFTILEIH